MEVDGAAAEEAGQQEQEQEDGVGAGAEPVPLPTPAPGTAPFPCSERCRGMVSFTPNTSVEDKMKALVACLGAAIAGVWSGRAWGYGYVGVSVCVCMSVHLGEGSTLCGCVCMVAWEVGGGVVGCSWEEQVQVLEGRVWGRWRQ